MNPDQAVLPGYCGTPPPDVYQRLRARARHTDPEPSHQAAKQVETSGRAGTQRVLCLDEVWRRPGLTAAEIAEAVGLERHIPSRRLPELRDAGLVRNGERRLCRVQGSQAMTWWPGRG